VAAIETEEGGKLAEGLIKSMAGSDRIAARQLYQEFFEYDPAFKVILTTNHKPRIKGTDFAIWRRIRLVPFTWRIPDDKVDPDIFDKLKAEMPGILAWAVSGCMEWQRIGKLESPKKVNDAVAEYQKDQDLVRRFVEESCDIGKEFSVSLKELYEIYEKWSKDNGEYFLSKNRFSKRLVEMGMDKFHSEGGARFRGIREHGNELF
jgi:putative DNA primase/helicase